MSNFQDSFGPWAVITGASSGIGRAFAVAIANRGINVAIVARRTERLQELQAQITGTSNVQVDVVTADLANSTDVSRVANLFADRPVGLLVNNAGINTAMARFYNQPWAELERMITVNNTAALRLMHASLSPMVNRGRGGVINVASTGAFQGVPYMAVYGGTKASLLSIGDAVASELRGSGVQLQTLCPGPTDTEITGHVGLERDDVKGMLMTPESVVEASLNALGRKTIVIPGLMNAIGAQLAQRLAPRRLLTAGIRRSMERLLDKAAKAAE